MIATTSTNPGGFRLLLRLRGRLIRNRLAQAAEAAPLRMVTVVLFTSLIWYALYEMFDRIFVFLRMFREQSVVVIPYIFHIFFAAMTVLLSFSSAILTYSALFRRPEPAWLLAAPMRPRSVVAIVYLEAVFFASWSLVLLGLPLMVALGRVEQLPWYFYVTFLVAFIGFVPIPGAIGLLAAWSAAMWTPRSARRIFVVLAAATIVAATLWWARLWGASRADPDHWLSRFLAELGFLRGALLPSTWVTQAIRYSAEARPADAAFYLFVTVAHAVFLGWLAVGIVSRHVQPAFGRAQSSPTRTFGWGGRVTRIATDVLFGYLPRQVRCLILKDVRAFFRDPMQWSQLAILLGLLALYLLYLPRMHPDGFNLQWQGLICFLNYGAVVLILSTFTSRFVFPMISLEGRQIWLLGLWPVPRSTIVWAKFDFALAVTTLAAMLVTALSIRALELPLTLSLVHVAATLSSCVGLCGLAIGLGSRMPSYGESSGARIASSVGGTINLIASMILVLASLGLIGWLCYRSVFVLKTLSRFDAVNLGIYAAQIALGFGSGSLAMRIGVRHFTRSQF